MILKSPSAIKCAKAQPSSPAIPIWLWFKWLEEHGPQGLEGGKLLLDVGFCLIV